MYMPGRLRTASSPSRTWIAEASYSTPLGGTGGRLCSGLGWDTGTPSWPVGRLVDMEQAVRAVQDDPTLILPASAPHSTHASPAGGRGVARNGWQRPVKAFEGPAQGGGYVPIWSNGLQIGCCGLIRRCRGDLGCRGCGAGPWTTWAGADPV